MANSLQFYCVRDFSNNVGECVVLHLPSEMGSYGNFLDDSRFRSLRGDDHCIDHHAVLSYHEALELVRLYYRKSPLNDENKLEKIRAAITGAHFVVAHFNEWESGL